MTSRIQTLRFDTPLARPADQSAPSGTLYTHVGDRQLGVMDRAARPVDLLAVRWYADTAAYTKGDYVVRDGDLLRALIDVPAGPFDPAQWVSLSRSPITTGGRFPDNPREGDVHVDPIHKGVFVYSGGHWINLADPPAPDQPFVTNVAHAVNRKGAQRFELPHTPGLLLVWLNGALLSQSDWTDDDAGFTLKAGLSTARDTLSAIGFLYPPVQPKTVVTIGIDEFTQAAGQSVFSLAHPINHAFAFLNGALLSPSEYQIINTTAMRGVQLFAPLAQPSDRLTILSFETQGPTVANIPNVRLETWDDVPGRWQFAIDYTRGLLFPFVNGAMLAQDDFTALDEQTLVLEDPMMAGHELQALSLPTRKEASVVRDIVMQLLDDANGTHAPGETFHYEQFRRLELMEWMQAWQTESNAEVLRALGGSGLLAVRNYAGERYLPFDRTHDVGSSAMFVHDHPNIGPAILGTGELFAVVNGWPVRTRHLDYSLAETRPTAADPFAYENIDPPALPASVTGNVTQQADELREYFIAYAEHMAGLPSSPTLNRGLDRRDFRDYFRLNLTYLECWFEEIDITTLNDASPSIRHRYPYASLRDLLYSQQIYNYTGMKQRGENGSFLPTVIRRVRADGSPMLCVLNYRVVARDIGSLRDYDLRDCVRPLYDAATCARFGETAAQVMESRKQRFAIPAEKGGTLFSGRSGEALIDEWMRKCWGFEGEAGVLNEKVEAWTTNDIEDSTQRLNIARYNRIFRYNVGGAAGTLFGRRGFNETAMWVAATTNPAVAPMPADVLSPAAFDWNPLNTAPEPTEYRYTWAIPLELVVRTPLESWNPYNLPLRGGNAQDAADKHTTVITGDGTEANPFDGYTTINQFSVRIGYYRVAAEFYRDIAEWQSGADYAKDLLVLDPTDENAFGAYQVYRSLQALTNSTTPPSQDSANWVRDGNPADTSGAASWVWVDGVTGGTKVKAMPSGVYCIGPPIVDSQGNAYRIRQRHPIYRTFGDGMYPSAQLSGLRHELLNAGIAIPNFEGK